LFLLNDSDSVANDGARAFGANDRSCGRRGAGGDGAVGGAGERSELRGHRQQIGKSAALTVGRSVISGGAFDGIFFEHAKTIYVEPFELPWSGRFWMNYDHGSTKPYACLFWWESDGSDIQFKSGRCRSTRPGDLFLIGEVYGYTGQPNQGTKESIAEITTKIQSYKIDRGWRRRDPVSGKWKDLFKRSFADNAIGEELNEFSVAAEFERPVRINGEMHPGIKWELVSKPPGSRVTGFALMRERLIATAPRPIAGYVKRLDCSL
jgi:hypothetical protein